MVKKLKIRLLSIVLFWFFSTLFFVNQAQSVGLVYFQLSASGGQGSGSNEFYQGRCFRVNINLNTGGNNTNGADVELNYNVNVLKIVQNDCDTQADTVYSDGLFNVYPDQGNSITSNKIKLSAYNNPGQSTNASNGLYGHFFVKVLDAVGDYTLAFQYTEGLTTDTNLVRTNGDGSDILDSVGDLVLGLTLDTDNPQVTGLSPTNNAIGVAVNSSVSFNLYDAMAGINSAVTTVRMRQGSGTWYTQSASLGSVQSSNQNRYYQYAGTVSPNSNIKTNNGYYEYNSTYSVEVNESDNGSPTVHTNTEVWSFTTEDDTEAPYVDSRNPADNATGISTSTNIFFRIKDYKNNGGSIPGLGVDDSSIAISVQSVSTGSHAYSCQSSGVTCNITDPNNITVTINTDFNFLENETVTVAINGSDLHSSGNAMVAVGYSFDTADTQSPVLSAISPAANSFGNSSSTNISFHVTDSGYGVALDALSVTIDSIEYIAGSARMTVGGDSSDYTISIDPISNFLDNSAVVVEIGARDQAPTPNYLSTNPYAYTFIVGLSTSTPAESCPVCATCTTNSCGSGGGGGTIYIKVPQTCPVYEPVAPSIIEKEVCLGQQTGKNVKLNNNTNTFTTAKKEVNKLPMIGGELDVSDIKSDTNNDIINNIGSSLAMNSSTMVAGNISDYNQPNTNVATRKNFDKWIFVVILLVSLLSFLFPYTTISRFGYIFVAILSVISLSGFDFSKIRLDIKLFEQPKKIYLTDQVQKESNEIATATNIHGRLVDFDHQPLPSMVVAVGDRRALTNKNGYFELNNIPPSDRAKIYGGTLSEPMYLDIRQITNSDVYIDSELVNFVNKVEKEYRLNRFKNLYPLLDNASSKNNSLEKFLDIYNNRLVAINNQYSVVDAWFDNNFQVLENWKSEVTKNSYKNVISFNFVRRIKDQNNDIKYLGEEWHIIKTENGYRLAI